MPLARYIGILHNPSFISQTQAAEASCVLRTGVIYFNILDLDPEQRERRFVLTGGGMTHEEFMNAVANSKSDVVQTLPDMLAPISCVWSKHIQHSTKNRPLPCARC